MVVSRIGPFEVLADRAKINSIPLSWWLQHEPRGMSASNRPLQTISDHLEHLGGMSWGYLRVTSIQETLPPNHLTANPGEAADPAVTCPNMRVCVCVSFLGGPPPTKKERWIRQTHVGSTILSLDQASCARLLRSFPYGVH